MYPCLSAPEVGPWQKDSFRRISQYWDDARRVSLEVKQRLVPEVEDEVPWDMFIVFGPEATWAEAERHVLGWGKPVIHRTEKLEALLSAASARDPDLVPDAVRSEGRHD